MNRYVNHRKKAPFIVPLALLTLSVCVTGLLCVKPLDQKYVAPTPKTLHFSQDTLSWNVPYSDTIHADSLSFGSTKPERIIFAFLDSVKGMELRDSVFSWTPADTGAASAAVTASDGNGACDTVKGSFRVIYGSKPATTFHFSKDTLLWNTLYRDTLRAKSIGVSFFPPHALRYRFIDSARGMELRDSIFSWAPTDTGRVPVRIDASVTDDLRDTVVHTFYIPSGSNPNPDNCPLYTHKDDVFKGRPSDLPSGYFVYAYDWKSPVKGLYSSKIGEFRPSLIPSTQTEKPRSIGISDDGKWILYVNGYYVVLLARDGSKRFYVPTKCNATSMAAFYRNGPYGQEICYTGLDVTQPIIHAVRVTFDSIPHFGADRIIADLDGKFRIEPYYPIAVSRDEILGAFTLRYKDTVRLRIGFLTIPDDGKGVATPANMYKWKNDDSSQFWGCNSTLSHDGTKALYISGSAGFAYGFFNCMPPEHQGFIVTPFRRDTDPPVGIHEHIDVYGLSINWVPVEYRFGKWDEMDFRGWYFGNRDDYVIGCQAGSLSPIKGIWMVDWRRNIWTPLTPPDSVIPVEQLAVFFSDSFAVVDDGNPRYRVVYPNGGEVFTVGQQCTVKVTSERDGNAGVKLSLHNGLYSFMLPGLVHAINPRVDSVVIFTMPESFALKKYNPAIGGVEEIPVSPVSDSCRISIEDYNTVTGFGDCSNGFFRIRAP